MLANSAENPATASIYKMYALLVYHCINKHKMAQNIQSYKKKHSAYLKDYWKLLTIIYLIVYCFQYLLCFHLLIYMLEQVTKTPPKVY